MNPDNVAPTLAKRRYHFRNTTVHNKEGETSRLTPFSGQKNIGKRNIYCPVLVAQLILKTGERVTS